MSAPLTSPNFRANAAEALRDAPLQVALGNMKTGFIATRARAVAALPEFDALRDNARDIKNHVLTHLDLYLERFEAKVREAGGNVHFARDANEACEIVLGLCREKEARLVTKSKSMITEEIGLNARLERAGITPVETDLGEYIIQLRGETPSHIIAPAIHLGRAEVERDFRRSHTGLDENRDLSTAPLLLAEARKMLRERFLAADVGITGANFLVAETGSSVIVTNEGNGDLTQILPKTHIVLASIEKIVPTLEDMSQIMRLLARSASGQEMSVYTTISTGPKRAGDPDGPQDYHVVLLDNGRSAMLGTPYQDMLRCIRCAACINHCPVYHSIGGHAYGWIYPGPMGSVLTPVLKGIERTGHLPNASTFCGRCEDVCPMRIPLPKMMRHWREKEFERHLTPVLARKGLRLWGFVASHPGFYGLTLRLAARLLYRFGRKRGNFSTIPFAHGWTAFRDLPAPQGFTFQERWRKERAGKTQSMGTTS